MAGLMEALRRPSITNEPPTRSEQRRNDLLMLLVLAIALLLGWGVRNNALYATQEFALGGQLPVVTFPASWIKGEGENVLLLAQDPASESTFDARLEVYARDLRPEEDLDLISASWPLRRSQELPRFRNLSTQVVTGAEGRPALLVTYAYVADPTRESGALGLPVVVKAQDLLFIANDGANDRLVVVTVACDATEWRQRVDTFGQIFQRLGLQGGAL